MPGTNLTRAEAEARAAIVSTETYNVVLDLTTSEETFRSTTTVTFTATAGEDTFIDLIAPTVHSIVLNGVELDPATHFVDSRIALPGLAEHNTLTVVADCAYMNTGEGLHRFVDPEDGEVYLYSQFEVADTRRVYAVFEQPDLKAAFSFTVTAPEHWHVLSNSPAVKTPAEGSIVIAGQSRGLATWTFSPTVRIPCYVTAIVAGPYHEVVGSVESKKGTIPANVYCRKALADYLDADVILADTQAGFTFYEEKFETEYPFEKYDQIFVPEFNAGAMENAGCVTFLEDYVFRSKPAQARVERRTTTVLHELAHMWFGDLVTMKWWNDLWLNESFAEFTSTLATAEATEWKDAWATFSSGEKSWALNQDQLSTTHPIVAPINDLNDTYVNFDGITYAKGASVLKQLVYYVGREKFFKGINNYLNKHAYSNATLADLLAELELTSGRDLKAWSAQWLEESGINTIATEVEENEDGTIKRLALRQTAPAEHPVLRAHRLAVGFYNEDPETGKIVRTDRFELDVDGELTVVDAAAGKARPSLILVNDDDLTYTKLRFDDKSLAFATSNLYRFDDALARSVIWLALWDMTRDGELPARQFIDTSLAALATEHESTTFRYALAQVSTTAWHYTAPAERAEIVKHVAAELFKLAGQAKAGSDEQFQLVTAYLGYGEPGDEAFVANAKGLLDGSVAFDGLEIDNNFRWTIINALSTVNAIDQAGIDAELAKRETTENREFAYGARAVAGTAEAKAWAWNEALHNDELTNMQLEAVAGGFAATPRADLAEPYAEKYFEVADWIWEHKTFHMAEALLEGLYPGYADPAKLVELGDAWLASHKDADNALQRIVRGNVEASHRTLKVRDFNAAL